MVAFQRVEQLIDESQAAIDAIFAGMADGKLPQAAWPRAERVAERLFDRKERLLARYAELGAEVAVEVSDVMVSRRAA